MKYDIYDKVSKTAHRVQYNTIRNITELPIGRATDINDMLYNHAHCTWGPRPQKQASHARMNNCVPQNNVGNNYITLPHPKQSPRAP